MSAPSGLDTRLEDERRGEAVRGLNERQRRCKEDGHPSKARQGGAQERSQGQGQVAGDAAGHRRAKAEEQAAREQGRWLQGQE